jgi:RNA polymerase sigma factor (sigma-70 family)
MVATGEKELILSLQNPLEREAAFGRLVKQYQKVLYYHIRRLVLLHEDADDVLQNTFLKVWRNLDSFRGDAAIKTWLYRIATNEALSFIAQKKRRATDGIESLENDLGHSMSQGRDVSGEEIQHKLQRAVQTLPERQRLVFNMRYYDDMRYEEMSDVLGVTEGALKASYHHAVKKIESYLTGMHP